MQKSASSAFGTYKLPQVLRPVVTLAQKTFLKRGFFRHKLGKVLGAIHHEPVDTEFCGAKFRLYPQDSNIDLGMLLNPAYNMKEIEFLRAHVPEGGIFVDIGANMGLYSILLSKPYGPAGLVLSVEPNPKVLARLRDNLKLAKPTNVLVIEAAVGAEDGEISFHSLDESLGGSKVTEDGELHVPLRKLASLCNENHVENIDALKIDIEGYEDQALLPFFKTAPKNQWPRALQIEQTRGQGWESSVLDYLGAIGYERLSETRSNALFVLKGVRHG
jgi:FkbM family methyltransferase